VSNTIPNQHILLAKYLPSTQEVPFSRQNIVIIRKWK